MTAEPTISVVVCTLNRPDHLRTCLESLSRIEYASWDIVIVDQSDNDETEALVRGLRGMLPPVTYVHTRRKGLAMARNLGVESSQSPLIAFLDDDCTVEADWLQQVAAAFDRHPDAALIFGAIEPAEHDPSTVFMLGYDITAERVFRGKRDSLKVHGMGGSMYLRLELCRQVGPFDVYSGAGARFGAGEETDFTYRVLGRGCTIVETPAIVVKHYGGKSHTTGQAREVVRRYNYCQGALDMKYLRCGDLRALTVIAAHIMERLSVVDYRGIVLGRRPTYLASFVMYLQGLVQSLRVPVIRQQRLWGRREDYSWANRWSPQPGSLHQDVPATGGPTP